MHAYQYGHRMHIAVYSSASKGWVNDKNILGVVGHYITQCSFFSPFPEDTEIGGGGRKVSQSYQ